MKLRYRLTTLALALLLPLTGLAQVQKDEIIYAKLGFDGQPSVVYLINAFEADEETLVTDYGVYSQVQPLGPVAAFAYAENAVTFTMPAGRFSYQGDLDSTALPWRISLSFTLDGEAIAPQALSGATGQLVGNLDIAIEEGQQALADSLSLQITLSLDGKRAYNIVSDRATHAVAGGARTLSFVVLPGQEASYTFSAQVRDFAMEGLQVAGVRMGLDTKMYQDAAAAALAGSPLEGAVSGLMANFLSGMQGKAPQSFSDARNPVRSVQFVLMGEGIPGKVTTQEVVEENGPQTFWERFLNIFGM